APCLRARRAEGVCRRPRLAPRRPARLPLAVPGLVPVLRFARPPRARSGGGSPAVWRPGAAFLRSYQLDGGYTPGPVLLLCTVTGLIGSAFALRRRLSRGARVPGLACLLFFASAVLLTLVSDVFVFSWRYQLPLLVTLVPAGALGISVIISAIRTRRTSRAGDGD